MSLRVLIAGLGDVGSEAARVLASAGHRVTGLRRRPAAQATPLSPGAEVVAGDLTAPRSLAVVAGDWDVIVYCPTPGERSEAAYRAIFLDGLRHLLGVARAPRVLFLSSTAVYGQNSGEWVDESDDTRPEAFNGRVLVEAEHRVRDAAPEGLALRLGGIYGPGREQLVRSARAAAGRPTRAAPAHWTNRIHRDDAGALTAHLALCEQPASCYSGVDSRPSERFEVLSWIAGELGLEAPVPSREPGPATGKRVRNERVLGTGFRFRWPDYRAGYGALLRRTDGTTGDDA